jgi:N-glycosylase/DNA lyase
MTGERSVPPPERDFSGAARLKQGSDSGAWTSWRAIDESGTFTERGFVETLDGGQMFRFNRTDEGHWIGVWGENVARVRLRDGAVEASFPANFARGGVTALRHLLSLDLPYGHYYTALTDSGDPVMLRAIDQCRGLRIVRQPLPEAVLSFLCSPLRKIAQIKSSLDTLANNFGAELMPGIRALPSWEALAEVGERDLRRCGLGFRAQYVAETAAILADEPDFFDAVTVLPYARAREKLCELYGVGGKVADCALLYSGACALTPFPVDTWVSRAMRADYGVTEDDPEKIAKLGRAKFGPLAGLAQQYLFVSARAGNPADEAE